VPFTASHVAAVLPLARGPLTLSALAAGSMAPDLPYYAPVFVGGMTTHSLIGSVGVDALLGALLFALWHGFLARPALAAAPAALQQRVPADAMTPLVARLSGPVAILWIYVSLCVGSVTHVVWDAFTHPGRWGTQHVTWLHTVHGGLAGHKWAQYGSGVLGACVVGLALLLWLRRTAPMGPVAQSTWWRPWALIVSSGVLSGLWVALTAPGWQGSRVVAFHVVTRGIAVAALVALVLATGWQLRRREG
jgi:hypothetical protein